MKGPGIKEYLEVLMNRKNKAIEEGEEYLIINSKELHAEISENFATMPTCCQAMYKVMLEGDEIIQKPKGETGFGSHLTIRYDLRDMENRRAYFEAKKRGRPMKSEEEKIRAKRLKQGLSAIDLSEICTVWLLDKGWDVTGINGKLVAVKEDERWVIDIHGMKRGRKQSLPAKMNDILKQMEDGNTRYSMAMNDSLSYRRQWNQIPHVVKEKLNVSVLLADKKGNVVEY